MKTITPENSPDTSRQLTMFDDITAAAPKPKVTTPAPTVRKKAPTKVAKADPEKAPLVPVAVPTNDVTVTVCVSLGSGLKSGAAIKAAGNNNIGGKRTPHAGLDPAALAKAREADRKAQQKCRAKKLKNGFARLEVYIPDDLDRRVRAQIDRELDMDASRWVARELELSLASIAAISRTTDPSRN